MSKDGFQNIFVLDHYTRFAVAVLMGTQFAKTVAEALMNNFIIPYGIPKRIHADQEGNSLSNLIKELCTLFNIKKPRTKPHHLMGNGFTERFNRTLLNMMGTLEPEQKKDWKKHVGFLAHAYKCTRQGAAFLKKSYDCS